MVSSFRMIFGIIACQLGYAAASLAQTSAGPTLPFGGSAPIPVSASPVTVLYNFGATRDDAVSPTQIGLLAEGRDGSLYGTTPNGGSLGKGSNGFGTVYRIAPDGTFSVLYNFDGTHGAFPQSGLILGSDGNFYGASGGPAVGFGHARS